MTTFECPRCGTKYRSKEQIYVLRRGKSSAALPVLADDKPKRGRPPIVGPRPWELAGISRRTWYRRQKEAKE